MNEQLDSVTESFAFIVPEIVLFAGTLILLVAGLFNNRADRMLNGITMVIALASLFALCVTPAEGTLFNGMLRRDGLANFLMVLVDISVVLACLMSLRRTHTRSYSEYFALIVSVALGSHMLLMSVNLVMVFLSLEVISIASYVLAGYSFTRSATEGSLKYFLFGSVASAVMIYGFSLLYGITGTLDFAAPEFIDGLTRNASPLVLIAGLMSLAGYLFKMAAVPMQPWAPDVYQAAPMPVIAYLSVAPKLAALGILAKFLLALHVFGQGEFDWQLIISVIAILTITVGNFSALWQKDAKRMMAYSAIAHSGFLLVGIAAFLPQGISFMIFYATVYLLMNFAVFTFLQSFAINGIDTIPSFSGAGKSFLVPAVGITIALVALTGLPPTAGFTAKLLIFSGLWEAYAETDKMLLLCLLIFGLLNTVVSLFFYLRIPYYAFLKEGTVEYTEKKGAFENLLGLILVLVIVGIFFLPGLLMGLINRIKFVL